MEYAVRLRGVTKTYHPRKGDPVDAVRNVDLEIPRGVLFGFLGPNGAGKTTLMDMTRGALVPTSGTLEILGHPLPGDERALKARLGVSPQEDNLDPDFTVEKNLRVHARYFDIPKAKAAAKARELLAFVELTDKATTRVDHLSGGMKRRLVLARALMNEPQMLVLDEPTTGLDPQARHVVWNAIGRLRSKGITILMTTHYMEEAERLCDELVVVDQGRILERGTPADLVEKYVGTPDAIEVGYNEATAAADRRRVQGLLEDERHEQLPEATLIYTRRADELAAAIRKTIQPHSIRVRRTTLEDVFLALTGRELRE